MFRPCPPALPSTSSTMGNLTTLCYCGATTVRLFCWETFRLFASFAEVCGYDMALVVCTCISVGGCAHYSLLPGQILACPFWLLLPGILQHAESLAASLSGMSCHVGSAVVTLCHSEVRSGRTSPFEGIKRWECLLRGGQGTQEAKVCSVRTPENKVGFSRETFRISHSAVFVIRSTLPVLRDG